MNVNRWFSTFNVGSAFGGPEEPWHAASMSVILILVVVQATS